MPAKGKVSHAWQIIMVLLIPIAGIWAFYRIKRLQKAFLYIMLPQIIMVVIVLVAVIMMIPGEDAMDSLETFGDDESAFDPIVFGLTTLSSIIGLGITALAIYLIIKWTEEWNKQFS